MDILTERFDNNNKNDEEDDDENDCDDDVEDGLNSLNNGKVKTIISSDIDNDDDDDNNNNQLRKDIITSKDIDQLLNDNKQDSYRLINEMNLFNIGQLTSSSSSSSSSSSTTTTTTTTRSISITPMVNDIIDIEQLERDKNAVYSHPLFPLLALLFEKCELATQSITAFETDSNLAMFNREIEDFINHHHRTLGTNSSFFTDDPEVDSLMIKAIQVFRIHLLELEKVSQLCQDFCQRYISCLRSKMRSDNLIRGNGHQSSMNNGKKNHSSSSSTSSPHSFMDDEYDIDMDVEPMDDDNDDDRDLAPENEEDNTPSLSFLQTTTTIPNEQFFCSNSSPPSSSSSSSSSSSYSTQQQISTSSLHQPPPSPSLSISSQKSNPSSSSLDLLDNIIFNCGQKSQITSNNNHATIMSSGLSNSSLLNFDNTIMSAPSISYLKSMSKCLQQQQQPQPPQQISMTISNNCDSNSDSNDEDDDGDDDDDNDLVHDLSLKSKSFNSESNINDNVDNNNDLYNNRNDDQREVSSYPPIVQSDQPKLKKVKTEKQSIKKKCSNEKQTATNINSNNNSKRGVLPKHATSIMRLWLFQHIVHPYPTEDEKRTIASETNLTLLQVNNWFINARRRILQPMLDSANNSIHHGQTKSLSESSSSSLSMINDPGLDLTTNTAKTVTRKTNRKHSTTTTTTTTLKTKSKTKSQQRQQSLNRFWPQSLANIIQTNDVNPSAN
ncbi:homeobox protein unc-62 [Dermatophagoides farinae]|uniref:homeobox protein unc-62 n=1 Tax=Dermatophagoides farinae TaxID=6954 RepID=UPI003F60A6D6